MNDLQVELLINVLERIANILRDIYEDELPALRQEIRNTHS